MRKGIIVHINENAKRFGCESDPSKQPPKKLTVRRAALVKALPLGADRARMRATTAERIMFRYCLAFADWNYEIGRRVGVTSRGTKDRAQAEGRVSERRA